MCVCVRALFPHTPKVRLASSATSKFPWGPPSHSLMKFSMSLFYRLRT